MKYKIRYLFAGAVLVLVAVIMYPDGSCRIAKKVEGQIKIVKTLKQPERLIIRSEHKDFTKLPIELFHVNPSLDTLTVVRNITAVCMLDLLKEYCAECYPDSIRFIPPNSFESFNPTFLGFMKFLDEKYKQ